MHLIKKTRCKKKKPLFSGFIFGGDGGSRRLLRLCLAYFWLGDRCFATVPASPLFAKNSSPNCFIYAQTLSGSTHIKMQKAQNCCTFCFGGDGGSRTHVRNYLAKGSTSVVCCLRFPSPNGNKHPFGYGSLYYLTEAKTFFCSCSPLSRRSQSVRGTTERERKGAYAAFKETVLLSVNFKVLLLKRCNSATR